MPWWKTPRRFSMPRRCRTETVRRSLQHSISCKPSEWKAIKARANAFNMSTSRFIIRCALVENDDRRLGLSEDEQRALADGVERLATGVEALVAPLPGSGVTLHGALTFLHLEAKSQQTRRKHPARRQTGPDQPGLPGLVLDGDGR